MPDTRYRVKVGDRVLELDLGTARFAIRSGKGVWVDEHEQPIVGDDGQPAMPCELDQLGGG